MKTNYWWMLAASLSAAGVASADDQPAGATPRKDAAQSTATQAAPKLPPPTDPISGPGPAIVSQKNVNVRGQARINSEVITKLNRGDRVTVLEEVTLSKPKQDEPGKWAKIALPSTAAVWAHSSFIDTANNTVNATKLNLRSGPGEQYSIVGRIDRGAAVKPIDKKGDWVKLEPPANAYGFVAAHLLAKDRTATALAATTPPPIETAVPANPTPAPAAEPTVPATTTPPPALLVPPSIDTPPTTAPAAVTDPATTPSTPEPTIPAQPAEDPFIKRVITREGIVERSVSIQAPSHFILQALGNKRTINYLFSPTTNVMLKDYRGQRIIVTGEEVLDERWPNTPVIEIETIEAVP